LKILKLRFCNLNSLVGEWMIDFTHPDYIDSGIFAIVGSTGAGKTTLLDAICLALYGQTPRLTKITKNENELMSQQTGKCFAEVEFTTSKGSFRCHWSQKRARNKTDGNLQSPKHEISHIETHQIIESKKSEVLSHVENLIGMDFKRFCRSVLLAQGDFSVFLHSHPDERSPILEQITGTEIYSRLSIKVHQQRNELNSQLDITKAELDGLQYLTFEETTERQQQLEQKTIEDAKLTEQQRQLEDKIQNILLIESLQKEIVILTEESEKLQQEITASKPQIIQLVAAKVASTLDADYEKLTIFRQQQNQIQQQLQQDNERCPPLENHITKTQADFINAQQQLKLTEQQNLEKNSLFKQVRELDTKISEKNKQLSSSQNQLQVKRSEHDKSFNELIKNKNIEDEINKELLKITDFLEKNKQDNYLTHDLNDITRQTNTLNELKQSIKNQNNTLEKLTKSQQIIENELNQQLKKSEDNELHLSQITQTILSDQQQLDQILENQNINKWRKQNTELQEQLILWQRCQDKQKQHQVIEQQLQLWQKKSSQLKQDQQQTLNQLEQINQQYQLAESLLEQLEIKQQLTLRIQSLEEQRLQLKPEQHCPLCGSLDHPFITTPPTDSTVQEELKLSKKNLKSLNNKRQSIELLLNSILTKLDQMDTEHLKLTDELQILTHELEDLFQQLEQQQPTLKTIEQKILELQQQIKHFQQIVDQADNFEGQIKSTKDKLAKEQKKSFQQQQLMQQKHYEVDHIIREIESLRQTHKHTEKSLTEQLINVTSLVLPYGFTDLSDHLIPTVLSSLEDRHDSFQSQKKQHELQSIQQVATQHQNQLLQHQIAMMDQEIKQISSFNHQQQSQIDTLQQQREELFDHKNIDEEEHKWQEKHQQQQQTFQQSKENLNHLKLQLSTLQQKIKEQTELIESIKQQCQKQGDRFRILLDKGDFSNENTYLEARLPIEKQQAIENTQEQLKHQEIELHSQIDGKTKQFNEVKLEQSTDDSLEELKQNKHLKSAQLKELQQAVGAIQHELKQQQEQQQKLQKIQQNISQQENTLNRWKELHHLIGSNDGKKFRNFAQSMTFEIMIAHANQQLAKLNDRYALVRNQESPLELEIIDNFHAGKRRSTKNLSGGESFIISLALALGLSQMSSQNIQVDSLFLDEGFGTLDEETLDIALNTLASLHHEGKTIGIISHVALLKERIGVQIHVQSGLGGVSKLSGPGCLSKNATP
jgi:DNA repair protein SbcC/Rad50